MTRLLSNSAAEIKGYTDIIDGIYKNRERQARLVGIKHSFQEHQGELGTRMGEENQKLIDLRTQFGRLKGDDEDEQKQKAELQTQIEAQEKLVVQLEKENQALTDKLKQLEQLDADIAAQNHKLTAELESKRVMADLQVGYFDEVLQKIDVALKTEEKNKPKDAEAAGAELEDIKKEVAA